MKDFDLPATPKFRPLAGHGRDQQIALLRRQHVLTKQFLPDGARAIDGQSDMPGMLHARHFIRILHHPIDLITEPDIDRFIDQSARHNRQQNRRDQREADKGGDQLGAKPRSDQPMAPLEIGFDQIA